MVNQRMVVGADEAARPLFVGVDIGGTNTKIGLVDDQGRTVAYTSIRTEEEKGPESAVQRISQAIGDLLASQSLAWDDVAAVGLGTPGSMDIPRGMILEPPNMPHWRYYPLRDKLGEACGKQVGFANDANAAAYGEFWVGSGRDYRSMVMFTLGTGVGGGIILDGVSVDGAHSFGSELGHIIIDQRPDARECVWGGGRGQLEAYASAPAVVERVREALEGGEPSSLRDRMAAGESLSTLMLAEEAEQGDAFSQRMVLETGRHLAVGIVSAVHTVDPEIVVLGGAMNFGGHDTKTGRMFLEEVQREFRERAYHVVAESTLIDFAQLGGDAGYIGAAGIGRAAWSR